MSAAAVRKRQPPAGGLTGGAGGGPGAEVGPGDAVPAQRQADGLRADAAGAVKHRRTFLADQGVQGVAPAGGCSRPSRRRSGGSRRPVRRRSAPPMVSGMARGYCANSSGGLEALVTSRSPEAFVSTILSRELPRGVIANCCRTPSTNAAAERERSQTTVCPRSRHRVLRCGALLARQCRERSWTVEASGSALRAGYRATGLRVEDRRQPLRTAARRQPLRARACQGGRGRRGRGLRLAGGVRAPPCAPQG